MLPDERDDAARDVNRDGPQALLALGGVLDLSAHSLKWHANEVGKKVHLNLIVKKIRARNNSEARAIAHDLPTVPVEDAPARCLRVDDTRPVALRLLQILLA